MEGAGPRAQRKPKRLTIAIIVPPQLQVDKPVTSIPAVRYTKREMQVCLDSTHLAHTLPPWPQ